MNEHEKKAFELYSIAYLILNRTPLVCGYAAHNKATAGIKDLKDSLSMEFDDMIAVIDGEKWKQIRKILVLE